MKKMSRYFSLAVAAVITLCLCSFGVIFEASADTVSTITINKPSNSSLSFVGHNYTAYKVFKTEINATGDAYTYTLDSNCLNPAGYGTEYQPTNDSINTAEKARAFGEYLKSTYIDNKSDSEITAYKVSTGVIASDSASVDIAVEQAGYYLIVDSYAGTESVVSLVMLDTLAKTNESIVVKADPASSLSKFVMNDDLSAWGTVTDTEIGESAQYKLVAKIPKMDIEEYNSYTFKIEDILDAGLTYNGDAAVYTSEDKTAGTEVAATSYVITAPTSENGNKLTIDFTSGIKAMVASNSSLKGANLYVFYTAKLNGNANYATSAPDVTDFNKNAAKLIYSKSPYGTDTLETAANLTYDWTFGVSFTKVNKKGLAAVGGAKFKVTQGGADVKFTQKTEGVYYVDPNSSNTELICKAADGTLVLYGFDDSVDYTLIETEAPSGFGLGGNTTFTINNTAYSEGGAKLDTISYTITGPNVVDSAAVAADGVVYTPTLDANGNETATAIPARIWNTSGTELIGTGGIGTTIFYVAGGVLMVGAAILLLTKLRMRNKD